MRRNSGDTPFGKGHFCGGSLISTFQILTAAHCLFTNNRLVRPKDLKVVMGTLNRFQKTQNTVVIAKGVTYFYHAGYQPNGHHQNDIAVLYFSRRIPASHPVIKPIPLNTMTRSAGTPCSVAGWGYTNYEKMTQTETLLEVDVEILDKRQCQEVYANLWHNGMMCAGDWTGARDSCSGDSGGGLICNDVLVGIVSWGLNCGEPGYPGVYTNVADYIDWMRNKNLARSLPPDDDGVSNLNEYFCLYSMMLPIVFAMVLRAIPS